MLETLTFERGERDAYPVTQARCDDPGAGGASRGVTVR
jgi:hypothetical protein